MVSPIHSTSAVPVQQRIQQIQAKIDPSSTEDPASQPVANNTNVTGSGDSSNTRTKLAELAQMMGIDKEALLSALQSGDSTKVTALITSAGVSSLGAATSEPGSRSDDASPMAGLGSGSTSELQSRIASLGRTGLQFDGRL